MLPNEQPRRRLLLMAHRSLIQQIWAAPHSQANYRLKLLFQHQKGWSYGTEAMHLLRAEKGFIMIGQKTDGIVTPQDLGLD